MSNYLIIENFLNNEEIDTLFKNVNDDKARIGKYGDRFRIDKKIRTEYPTVESDLLFLDQKLENIRNELYIHFNKFVLYREKWKIGYYKGSDKGFYTEHRDNQCRIQYRKISCICMLSNPEDYEGGELYFSELNKEFKLPKGSIIFFDPNLLHGVKPVTKGERYVLVTFTFDVEGSLIKQDYNLKHYFNNHIKHKYILPLTPDSGPGNQIISIKECLLLSRLLNRICILPPIHSHYTTKSHFWDFNEIFKITDHLSCYYDKSTSYNFDNIYGCHGKYTFETLKLEKQLKIENKKTQLLNTKNFEKIEDIDELKTITDEVICLKHIYNHVRFNNCNINGCSNCKENDIFLQIYKEICTLFDYSDAIKKMGNDFITTYLDDTFISIHIRYPDRLPKDKSLKDFCDYDENTIYGILENLKKERKTNKVFIATNNIRAIKNSKLKEYVLYDINNDNPINTFIEQYICCCSTVFIMSKYNDYRKTNEQHIRSTWSSFVYDYRLFKNNNKNNIYIQSIL